MEEEKDEGSKDKKTVELGIEDDPVPSVVPS